MENLPEDLSLLISSFLEDNDDIVHWFQCNQYFYKHLTKKKRLIHWSEMQHNPSLSSDESLIRLSTLIENFAEQFDVTCTFYVPSTSIFSDVHKFRHVKVFSELFIQYVLPYCEKIRILTLENKSSTESLQSLCDSLAERCSEFELQELNLFDFTVESLLPYFPSVTSLSLSSCYFTGISEFQFLQKLTLEDCSFITDVSVFGHIPELKLSNCDSIVTIDGLDYNSKITISNCLQLYDFRKCFKYSRWVFIELEEVISPPILNFPYYTEMTFFYFDSASFDKRQSKVKRLPRTIKRFFVNSWTLFSSITYDNQFQKLQEIRIFQCESVEILPDFSRIPIVCLCELPNLQSVEGVFGRQKGNAFVDIDECPLLTDFSSLRYVNKVWIQNCKGLSDANNLSSVKELFLINCENVADLSPLIRVEKLVISNCGGVQSLHRLSSLKEVTLLQLPEETFRRVAITKWSNTVDKVALDSSEDDLEQLADLFGCSLDFLDERYTLVIDGWSFLFRKCK